jgi:glycosyltransferase involved in cell wall biosynthesis
MYQRAPGFYFGHRDTVLFRNVMRQSKFTLCPRGSGITSFRLYEALQVGSIPIYVSDIFRCPFENKIDWKEICLFFKLEEIGNIEQAIKAIPEKRVNEMRAAGQHVVEKYFNLRGTCNEILEVLKTL